MKKILLLTVLSVLLVFGLASNALAMVEIYPNFGTDPAYPSILYFGPATLNAYTYSDTSNVKSVNFTVYQSGNETPILNADASNSTSYYNDGNWIADIGIREWASGDYRVDATAVNGVNETTTKSAYFRIEANNVLTGTITNWTYSPLKYSSLYFHEPGQEYWFGTYGWVDEYGRFAVSGLISGEKCVSVFMNGQVVQVGTIMVNADSLGVSASNPTGSISINDSGKIVIVTPKPGVTGRLVRNGVALSDANITIQKVGTYEYYWTMSDKNGNIGLDLADGEYIIREVNSSKGFQYLRVILDKPFTVSGGVDLGDINVPGANVTGVITGLKAPMYPTGYSYGVNMSFVKQGVDDNGYDMKYFWTNAPYDSVSGQYKFELFLPDGTYSLNAHSMNGPIDFFGESFMVTGADDNYTLSSNEANKIITVENGELKIAVPADNVTGTVKDVNGNPLAYASLMIKPADDTGDWSKYKWMMTDENGNFSLFLPDGNYVATDMYHQGFMGTQSYQFTVNNSVQLDLTLVP